MVTKAYKELLMTNIVLPDEMTVDGRIKSAILSIACVDDNITNSSKHLKSDLLTYHPLLRYKLKSSSGPKLESTTQTSLSSLKWRLDYVLRNSHGVAITKPIYTITCPGTTRAFQLTKSQLQDWLFKLQDAKARLSYTIYLRPSTSI